MRLVATVNCQDPRRVSGTSRRMLSHVPTKRAQRSGGRTVSNEEVKLFTLRPTVSLKSHLDTNGSEAACDIASHVHVAINLTCIQIVTVNDNVFIIFFYNKKRRNINASKIIIT